ncbi:hypothetical protein CJ030_MR7G028075 [Morella rubra]|uniref:Uncharacterized protein n=1 Tax=Morella rubra TaxID=262757 RepID=A0A6A1V3E7_9ROSI|nr:hypothetical protein CJ030_MR7G028075 [Morella rubra]
MIYLTQQERKLISYDTFLNVWILPSLAACTSVGGGAPSAFKTFLFHSPPSTRRGGGAPATGGGYWWCPSSVMALLCLLVCCSAWLGWWPRTCCGTMSWQGHGLSWHVCGKLAGMPGMGVAGASCLVRGAKLACVRALMPWHGCGALIGCPVGVSRVPMGATGTSSQHLSSHALLSRHMSSLGILSKTPL